jgi:hypothetical protein
MTTTVAVQTLGSLAGTDPFHAPIETLSLVDVVEAYFVAYTTEEIGKTRREALREVLLNECKAQGIDNEKGGQRLTVNGHRVTRERRVASSPDEKKLIALLEKKGLSVEDGFDKVVTLQPNASKVNALVERGFLSEEEASTLYKESFACVVTPNDGFNALVENALPAGAVEKKVRNRK